MESIDVMPHFIVERTVENVTREELQSIAQRSKAIYASVPGLVWIRSYVSEADGKFYCEYDAPSADSVREASRLAGLPIDRISEITVEMSPEMFR